MPARRPLLLLLPLTLAACERAPAPGHAVVDVRHTPYKEGSATPVARWQGDVFTAEALEQRLLEMSPALRERYQTPAARREYVESVARFEMLVQEALARGLHEDAEVVASFKRALVSRLMRQQLEQTDITVTDAEVAEAYERQRGDFVRPAQVRLSHVFLAAPRTDAAQVAAARPQAEALLAQARALPPLDFGAFGKLAREHSQEPRTQPLDGDMRFLSDEALARAYGPELLEAVRGLTESGTVAGPVQTEAGFHILKLQGRQPAVNLSLEDMREQLTQRLRNEKQTRAWADFLESVARRQQLTLDEAALGRVSVDLQAPMRAPSGPMPGTVPAPYSPGGGTP
ncbi:peptidylprolyl isomerase [Hyalangium rubrum]|uniref:Peptidylprolyl isomerase n=1 Tax=Hyalangium rubrum TaxID=3103134 RepID=A0ABU5GXV6_9BACT|nr:peptidylprolyl isomerase [Hyalangium sp. s54d21]MDY7226028.1 peptidylprolyl isomerase [Hyalangium sp. s54d21]